MTDKFKKLAVGSLVSFVFLLTLSAQEEQPPLRELGLKQELAFQVFISSTLEKISLLPVINEMARLCKKDIKIDVPLTEEVSYRFTLVPCEEAMLALLRCYGYDMVRQADGKWHIVRSENPLTILEPPLRDQEPPEEELICWNVHTRPFPQIMAVLKELTGREINSNGDREKFILDGHGVNFYWRELAEMADRGPSPSSPDSSEIRVTATFDGANLGDVINHIAIIASISMVDPMEYKEKVALHFRSLPWLQAFDAMLYLKGRTGILEDDSRSIWQIRPLERRKINTFTGTWKDTEISEVIRGIANAAHKDIELPPHVQGKISVEFAHATWLQALQQVMAATPWPEYVLVNAGAGKPVKLATLPAGKVARRHLEVHLHQVDMGALLYYIASLANYQMAYETLAPKKISLHGQYNWRELLYAVASQTYRVEERDAILLLPPDNDVIVSPAATTVQTKAATAKTWKLEGDVADASLASLIQGVIYVSDRPEWSCVFTDNGRRYSSKDFISLGEQDSSQVLTVQEIRPDKVVLSRRGQAITFVLND